MRDAFQANGGKRRETPSQETVPEPGSSTSSSGCGEPKHPRAAVLDVLESSEKAALTEQEVTERLRYSEETVNEVLKELETEGDVNSQRMLGRVMWHRGDESTLRREGIAVDQNFF